jgi:hypothetical protein
MKFITQFSPRSVFFLGPNIFLNPLFLTTPQCVLASQSEKPSFAPVEHNWRNYNFVDINL